jgi:hypothetical protein
MVSNPSEMILTTTLVTRASACVLKPQGVDKILDPQHGEAQHQVWLPHSFVLTNTIPNPMGALTSRVSRREFNSIFRSKALVGLLGVAQVVCQATLLSIDTLAILSI